MKNLRVFLAVLLLCAMITPAFAAPLFPDVPEQHWARDAVADLAAKGILEGYPDGTFKGDRATTRWEMAVALQRLLAKMEAAHATFATKADLEALRALVNNLKDELDALGVRVKNLEDNVAGLDQRVTELERITFEGDFAARLVTIGMTAKGITAGNWPIDVGTVNAINPGRNHKLGTIDLLNGRPYVNGLGFTARARLGVKVKVSKDLQAAVRFAAFTSLGNDIIDAYWGINAPYLSNPFTSNTATATGIPTQQGLNNAPWTRLTLDKLTLLHVPTNTMLVAGSIEQTEMDNFVLSRVPNPNISGKNIARFGERVVTDRKKSEVSAFSYAEDEETYLPFYGVQVKGKTKVWSDMSWEVMYSKLPFGVSPFVQFGPVPNVDITIPQLVAGNLSWAIRDQGAFKINVARVVEDNLTGTGAIVPSKGNYWGWTDPFSFLAVPVSQSPMRQTNAFNGFISQQSNTTLGASINYVFLPSNIRALAAYGHSWYKPNINSTYTAGGNHYRVGVGWTNQRNTLDLDLEWISTDPFYNAMQLYYPPVTGMLLGGLPTTSLTGFSIVPTFYGGFPSSYIPFGYQLHDSGLYPNNRQGIRFGAEYRFNEGNGKVNLRAAFLNQNSATAQQRDITGFINGMQPGFIDPIFSALYTDGVTTPEAPRGRTNQIGGGVEYTFQPSRFHASLQYDNFSFRRNSAFAVGTLPREQNYLDIRYNVLSLGLAYPTSERFRLNGGFDYASVTGFTPGINGSYIGAGIAPPLSNVNNLDVAQYTPYLGFDYEIAKNTSWGVTGRYIMTKDRLNDGLSPESFNALQLMTTFSVKF